MKKIYFLFIFYCAFLSNGIAQNASLISKEKSTDNTGSINYDALYLDAAAGYYPQRDNSSWAAQLSIGTRLNEASGLGIGGAYWGRVQAYKRSALGVGLQYRRSFWENFIAKIEGGYLLNRTMYDDILKKNMVFVPESSRPFYYKIDINLRFLHYCTIGLSACQSGNLLFRRFAGSAAETVDSWRINAFTIQLGIALDKPNN
jgi:hypothetical protein